MPMQRHHRGFTLIELLVVISIVSLLIALLVPALQKSRQVAMRTSCSAKMHMFGVAFQMYQSANKDTYPAGMDMVQWHTTTDGGAGGGGTGYLWSEAIFAYLVSVPFDVNHVSGTDGQSKAAAKDYYHCPDDAFPDVSTADQQLSYQMNCHSTSGFTPAGKYYTGSDGIGYTISGGAATGTRPIANMCYWDHIADPNNASGYTPPYTKTDWVLDPGGTILLCEFARWTVGTLGNWRTWSGGRYGTSGYKGTDTTTLHNNQGNFLFCDGHVKVMDPADTVGTGKYGVPLGMWTKELHD